MKASVEEISAIKRKISVEIPEDEVVKEVDSLYKDLGKRPRSRGFGPERFQGISWRDISKIMSRQRWSRN